MAHLVILVFSRQITNHDAGGISPILDSGLLARATPFVMASGIVAGLDRWPAGRAWLVAAAIAFGLAALLDAAGELWLALHWPPDFDQQMVLLGVQTAAPLLMLASLIAPLGPLLAAAGLWQVPSRASRSVWQAGVILLGALVATGVLALRVLMTIDELTFSVDGAMIYQQLTGAEIALNIIDILAGGGLALTGLAALRAIPRRYLIPEALIGGGALAAVLVSTTARAALSFSMTHKLDFPSWIPALVPFELVGLVILVVGFFSAGISIPGEN